MRYDKLIAVAVVALVSGSGVAKVQEGAQAHGLMPMKVKDESYPGSGCVLKQKCKKLCTNYDENMNCTNWVNDCEPYYECPDD